jgi:hypothetical protein
MMVVECQTGKSALVNKLVPPRLSLKWRFRNLEFTITISWQTYVDSFLKEHKLTSSNFSKQISLPNLCEFSPKLFT